MATSMKYFPASAMVSELVSGDKSNRKFVASLKEDVGETARTEVSLQQ